VKSVNVRRGAFENLGKLGRLALGGRRWTDRQRQYERCHGHG
jgi:hypothetical protein